MRQSVQHHEWGSDLSWLQYQRRLLREVFTEPWGWTETIATVVGLIIPLLIRVFRLEEARMTPLSWEIPIAVFACLTVVRVVIAPYRMYKDHHHYAEQVRTNLEQEIKKQQKPQLYASIQHVRIVKSLRTRLMSPLLKELGEKQGRKFPDQPLDVYIQLYMANSSSVATTIRDYQLMITTHPSAACSRFSNLKHDFLDFDETVVDKNGFDQTRSNRELLLDDLADEINKVPIEHAKAKVGWLRFSCGGVKPDEITANTLRLTAVDALNGIHEAQIEPNAKIQIEERGL